MNILLEILPMIVSLLIGMYSEHTKNKAIDEARHNEAILLALKAGDSSFQLARKYRSPTTSWSRKFIVQSVVGSLFLFPMILTVLNLFAPLMGLQPISISIPQEILQGRGVFDWVFGGGDKGIVYIQIYGFVLLPIHMLLAQTITGFYFGQSAMKR